jgi:uncharacterized protein YdeI (YjbR/CyaY-like superfamily)
VDMVGWSSDHGCAPARGGLGRRAWGAKRTAGGGGRVKGPVDVEAYLREGCGRCDRYRTPSCKVHRWHEELVALRQIARGAGLREEIKWGAPCYTLDGKNVAMVFAFNESCGVSFFKGAALRDPDGVLELPGPNSREGRVLRVRSPEEVRARAAQLRVLLEQAIALAREGVPRREAAPVREAAPESLPDALADRLAADPALRRAFDALTPGRRRSHALHVGGAKQRETRDRRAERCAEDILAGRGFNER